jgi:hypothetical protein
MRDFGEQAMFFESIGVKEAYASYWRLGDWFLFWVVQILFKQLTIFLARISRITLFLVWKKGKCNGCFRIPQLWQTSRILPIIENSLQHYLRFFDSVKNRKRKSSDQSTPEMQVVFRI